MVLAAILDPLTRVYSILLVFRIFIYYVSTDVVHKTVYIVK